MLASQQEALQAFLMTGKNFITIAPWIEGSLEDVQQRLAIYYDAYRWRMIEILQVAYPKLAAWLGNNDFAELVIAYIETHPSQHISARYIGGYLSQFLQQRGQPFLAELAQFEWALGHVLDAVDSPLFTTEDLHHVTDTDWPTLLLSLRASVQLISLHFNAPFIWQQLAENKSPSAPEHHEKPITWVIWRYEQTAYFASLDNPSAHMFSLLQQGLSFADVCEQLCDDVPSEEVPLFAVGFLQHWVTQDCIFKLP